MLVIDVFYEKNQILLTLGIIRLRPKNANLNDICTYNVILIQNNREINLDLKLDFPYGDSLKLSNYVIETMINKNLNIEDFINYSDIRIKRNTPLIIDVNINRSKSLQILSLNNKKIVKNNINYNLNVLTPLSKKLINLNEVISFEKGTYLLNILKQVFNKTLEKNFDFNTIYKYDKINLISNINYKLD